MFGTLSGRSRNLLAQIHEDITVKTNLEKELGDRQVPFQAIVDATTSDIMVVEREAETEDEPVLHFVLSDTGIGIPKENRQLVFADFARSDSSTTRRYGDTGLGLAIASQLVAMMGESVWVDSTVGVASTLHFTALFGKAGYNSRPIAANITRTPVQSLNGSKEAWMGKNPWRTRHSRIFHISAFCRR